MNQSIKKELEVLNQQIKELSGIYHLVANHSGISDSEFWVWYALLIFKGEYSQQDICDMWSLPKQTVNSVIASLIKKELVYLEVVPNTRNRKIIRLSEKGKVYGEAIVLKIYESEQRTLSKMAESERQLCITLLGKYITLLKEELQVIRVNHQKE